MRIENQNTKKLIYYSLMISMVITMFVIFMGYLKMQKDTMNNIAMSNLNWRGIKVN